MSNVLENESYSSITEDAEIIEDALLIEQCDEVHEESLQNVDIAQVEDCFVEFQGAIIHKATLLKNIMSGTITTKSMDRMKRAAGFSRYKAASSNPIERAVDNVFNEDNNDIFISQGDSIVLIYVSDEIEA